MRISSFFPFLSNPTPERDNCPQLESQLDLTELNTSISTYGLHKIYLD